MTGAGLGRLVHTTATISTAAEEADPRILHDLQKRDRSVPNQRTRRRCSRDQSGNKFDGSDFSSQLAAQRRPRVSNTSIPRLHPQSSDRAIAFGTTQSSLDRIAEGSDDEEHQNSTKSKKYSSRPAGTSRRYVNGSLFSRNRQIGLQHQLGSLPNSSLVSLFSTLTTSSGSSGNSTVTQRSYDRLAVRRKRFVKKRQALKDVEGLTRADLVPKGGRRSKMEGISEQRPIGEDVEPREGRVSRPLSSASSISRKDSVQAPPTPLNKRSSSSSSEASSKGPRKDSVQAPPTPVIKRSSSSSSEASSKGPRKEVWKRQDTFNSDSGISVSSSPSGKQMEENSEKSSDSDSEYDSEDESPSRPIPTARSSSTTVTAALSPLLALPDIDPMVRRLQDQEELMKQHILHSPRPHRQIRPQYTASYAPSPALPLYERHATSAVPALSPHGDPNYFHSFYETQRMEAPDPPVQLDMQKTTIAGYEQLASKITTGTIKPLYRKFEQLNHRILLHLQDEITEFEEELRVLDEMIAQTSVSVPEGIRMPSSRRADKRYGCDLHFQRTQVLGRVFLKMQQYNQALASYAKTQSGFSPAKPQEIAEYREWVGEESPVDEVELRFLEFDGDLVAPAEKKSPGLAPARVGVNVKQMLAMQCVLVVVSLLVFSLIPGVLAKLSLAVTLCGVGAAFWIYGYAERV